MIKSRRMRWAGHVARRGRREIDIGYWWESQKERGHYEDHDVGGWILLMDLGEIGGMLWIGLIWLSIQIGSGLL
jgi:hypothetical protein